jgi:hypothetical protein
MADDDAAEAEEFVDSSTGELPLNAREPKREGDGELEPPGPPPFILDAVGEVTGRKFMFIRLLCTRREVRPELEVEGDAWAWGLLSGSNVLVEIVKGMDSPFAELAVVLAAP